jgi:NAD(P)-dependent dehydrogenase (short-subunit alcohol dehydrogenase family)
MDMAIRNAFGLAGKTCVVTGAAGGIGRAIALAFAAEGAKVGVLDRNLAGAEATAELVRAAGSEALALGVDTSDETSIEAACAQIENQLGPTEALVNNAGIMGAGGELLKLSLKDWNQLLSINLSGYFLCSQVFGRRMVERKGGALVHVVSVTATSPMPFGGNYSVAKAGALMLSKLLAVELAPHGVRSNCVHPGLVQTPMTQVSYNDPDVARARDTIVPMGRVAQPEDMAQAALFLASPRASYVNGADLLVDGGLQAGLMRAIPSKRN